MLAKVKPSLILQKIGEETLAYDGSTEKAVCLSPIGSIVFEHCFAGKTMDELVSALTALGTPDPEAAAEESLSLLASEGLLLETSATVFDRRKFLQAAGAAAALPVVASVLAPRPAQAVSCNNCRVAANFAALDCNTCGDNCPEGVGCQSTSLCCYEYTLSNVTETGTCHPEERSGNYFCRSIPANRFFSFDCATARTQAVARPGAQASDTYYCCNCPASSPFTCPEV